MLRQAKVIFLGVALTAHSVALEGHARAQSNQPPDRYVVDAIDCNSEEHVKSLLDYAAITAGGDKTLIIITRLGGGEGPRKLIRQRLYAPVNYLVEERGVPKGRVITAEGERVRGPGRVEVYVGGDLLVVFKMKRNQHFGQGPRCRIIYD